MTTRILMVDDHQIVREGVRSLVGANRPEWELSEARDGKQAVEMIQANHPDLIIMDITMPGISGLDVVSNLRKSGFKIPVLMFTMHKSEQLGNDARRAGAQGYVLKSQAVENLIDAIDRLLAGGTFYGAPPASHKEDGKRNPDAAFCIGFEFGFA